ncbi:MAG: hypothetical protein EXS64_11845 [Candidatus Latescibacteria bacterium]|nr:hypothetical protein [Candidatus Latescibacterota bacterium]
MFKPDVPVFDGNAVLGRRHDQRVHSDSREGMIAAMDRAGISRALVHTPYAVTYDTQVGNRHVLELIGGEARLTPQFVVNFTADTVETFGKGVMKAGVRSLRVFPKTHLYPLTGWMMGDWGDWMAGAGVGLWVSAYEVDPKDLYEVASTWQRLRVILTDVHYVHHAVLEPLLRALPNLHVDLSRYDVPNAVEGIVARMGSDRLLYGSAFPDLDPAPYLFYLHHCGFDRETLQAICHDNLVRLLEK